ncbi:MAG: uracil-DNA glycosylase [Planctomycetes bacterium]|nr:uracil-DNA glycosylase [Planctomycetota bacterium]
MTTLRDTLRARLALERACGADLLPVPRAALARRPPAAPIQTSVRPGAPPSDRSPSRSGGTPAASKAGVPVSPALQVSVDPVKAAALAALETRAKACRLCRLCETRTQVVFGTGNPDADICLVGEAPGEDEDRLGEPFVGRAGQLLNQILSEAGLRRADVYICNVVKCRPSVLENGRRRNRPPEPEEVVRCQPYLRDQLALVRPRVIGAMGKFAVTTLLRVDAPMGQVRGRFQTRDGVPVMPTYHPAYLLRTPGDIGIVREDLKKIVAKVAEMKSKG